MNPIITFFQGLASHVPELLQPLIIALAGAVPFIEGEVSAVIGVWAGINPFVAGIAGAAGNFICVAVIVLLGARARRAVVARRDEKRVSAQLAAVTSDGTAVGGPPAEEVSTRPSKPESKGRIKFKRFLARFGVPGASLLGPLAIPTQITSTVLVSAGVKTSWILLWQGIAIACWATLTTLIATGALRVLTD